MDQVLAASPIRRPPASQAPEGGAFPSCPLALAGLPAPLDLFAPEEWNLLSRALRLSSSCDPVEASGPRLGCLSIPGTAGQPGSLALLCFFKLESSAQLSEMCDHEVSVGTSSDSAKPRAL
ncbi:hypothetical protein CapIbe_003648 [Capra ibex]